MIKVCMMVVTVTALNRETPAFLLGVLTAWY